MNYKLWDRPFRLFPENGGINLYGYASNNQVNAIDPFGLDVFFFQNESHGWVRIGGQYPLGGISYGAYLDGYDGGDVALSDIFGSKPAEITSPDKLYDKNPYGARFQQVRASPEAEAALIDWIHKTYEVNKRNSLKNPRYNILPGGFQCHIFARDVFTKLMDILDNMNEPLQTHPVREFGEPE